MDDFMQIVVALVTGNVLWTVVTALWPSVGRYRTSPKQALPIGFGDTWRTILFKLVLDEDHEVIPVPESTYKPKTGIKIRFEERESHRNLI